MAISPELAKCLEIVRGLDENTHEAIALWAIAQSGNRRRALLRSLDRSYAAHVWNLAYHTYAQYTLLVIARMCDPLTKRGQEGASIPHLIDLLSRPAIKAEVFANARGWLPSMPHRAAGNEARAKKSLRGAIQQFSSFQKSSQFARIRDFRHFRVAHDLRLAQAKPQVQFGEID